MRSFSDRLTHMTVCLMRSEVFPAEPIVTTAGLRRYVRAKRSTDGGMVAENMYVVLYLEDIDVVVCLISNAALSSNSSAISIGFRFELGIASITCVTCGSKPISIILSASSRTM